MFGFPRSLQSYLLIIQDPPTRMDDQGQGNSTEDSWSINQGSPGGAASNVNPMMDYEVTIESTSNMHDYVFI